MRSRRTLAFVILLALSPSPPAGAATGSAGMRTLTVGSKTFPESYLLAEIASQVIEEAGEVKVEREFGLGATGIVFQAITHGSIDVYPEYSGTIAEAFLNRPAMRELSQIREGLKPLGLEMTDSLGFMNTYALGVRGEFARQRGLKTLSDLARASDARLGLTHEIMSRADGYPGLSRTYGFHFENVRTLQHSLAYEALARDQLDVTDVYSTDADIRRLGLAVLRDDLHYFPDYQAVLLGRSEWIAKYPGTWRALRKLESSISQEKMIELNSLIEIHKQDYAQVARFFLHGPSGTPGAARNRIPWGEIAQRTREHLELVLLSLFSSILIGLPMGVAAYYRKSFRKTILTVSGLIQTIPSLALLAFLIPAFGIGKAPALVALFLYGLLPVVVNTFTGFELIEPGILESAQGLGLSRGRILWEVLLPIASPAVLAGIRTSAVIGIGTATLAALVGAGGYGAPIMSGLALNDVPTILQGAIPAAAMALLAQFGFDWIANRVIPRGLQK